MRYYPKTEEKKISRAVSMRHEGCSLAKIGRELGLSVTTVARYTRGIEPGTLEPLKTEGINELLLNWGVCHGR